MRRRATGISGGPADAQQIVKTLDQRRRRRGELVSARARKDRGERQRVTPRRARPARIAVISVAEDIINVRRAMGSVGGIGRILRRRCIVSGGAGCRDCRLR